MRSVVIGVVCFFIGLMGWGIGFAQESVSPEALAIMKVADGLSSLEPRGTVVSSALTFHDLEYVCTGDQAEELGCGDMAYDPIPYADARNPEALYWGNGWAKANGRYGRVMRAEGVGWNAFMIFPLSALDLNGTSELDAAAR